LSFDDADASLGVAPKNLQFARPGEPPAPNEFRVRYEDVAKVVAENTTHFADENGVFGALGWFGPAGAMAGAAAAEIASIGRDETDYFLYFAERPGVFPGEFVLRVSRGSVAAILQKVKTAFGDRLTVPVLPASSKVETRRWYDLDPPPPPSKAKAGSSSPKYATGLRKEGFEMPALHSDMGLVFAVSPSIQDQYDNVGWGATSVLYANSLPIAINREGTYAFAYLEPGEYQFLSRSGPRASEIRLKVEGGREYYFFQDQANRSQLSMHSKELAMFEIRGSYLAEWRGARLLQLGEAYSVACAAMGFDGRERGLAFTERQIGERAAGFDFRDGPGGGQIRTVIVDLKTAEAWSPAPCEPIRNPLLQQVQESIRKRLKIPEAGVRLARVQVADRQCVFP
jgi:hypothetical protein